MLKWLRWKEYELKLIGNSWKFEKLRFSKKEDWGECYAPPLLDLKSSTGALSSIDLECSEYAIQVSGVFWNLPHPGETVMLKILKMWCEALSPDVENQKISNLEIGILLKSCHRNYEPEVNWNYLHKYWNLNGAKHSPLTKNLTSWHFPDWMGI